MPTSDTSQEPGAGLPRPVLLLVNANSRRGKARLQEAADMLEAAGVQLKEARLAKDKADTERLLRREVEEGANTVIIGGGDGTLSLCAEYLVNTPVAMGVLPLGTGNTFARSLGIPVDLAAAVQTIANGQVQNIDVGQVNQQIFLNSVSLGLSVEIAGALTPRMKDKLGLFAWPVVATKIFLTHRPIALKLTDGDRRFRVRTHQLLVVNGRYVAGPIIASPEASVQDSELTVFTLGGSRKSQLVRVAYEWLTHKHVDSPAAKYFETQSLRVESRRRLIANVDGDLNEHTPLNIKVLPRALRVVVPHGFVADEV